MNSKKPTGNVSSDYSDNVKRSIKIISNIDGSANDKQVISRLNAEGIEQSQAIKIAILLPIAFCRLLLPDIKWEDQYYEFSDKNPKGALRKFSQNEDYQRTYRVAETYFSMHPPASSILNIAGRSSEFHAINQMMLNGEELEMIKLSPVSIVW
jgi:hypothetical protein